MSHKSIIRLRMSSHDAHYGGNLVDGARMRTTGRRRVQIALPRQVTDLHVDLGVTVGDAAGAAQARVSGPGFGARILVAGRELPLAIERRSAPRPSAG